MNKAWIFESAIRLEDKIISHRRRLHEIAEVGFALENTHRYVFDELTKLGYNPQKCGKRGIIAKIEGHRQEYAFSSYNHLLNTDDTRCRKISKNEFCSDKASPNIILRADMDALPMNEETDLPFKSTNGNMHSCGHDLHTAMLLGAAEILISNRDRFSSKITLMFQPAEEILSGANDMINDGLLDGDAFDFGAMIHVLTGTNLDTGTVIFSNSSICAPSADFFEIRINGKGAHGAMPEKAVDPILIGAHIILALEGLITRECAGINGTALTIGEINGGKCANVIPESVKLSGTLRTYDESKRDTLKSRIKEIALAEAKAFRGDAEVVFTSHAPVLENDVKLSKSAYTCLKNVLTSLDSTSFSRLKFDAILAEPSPIISPLASEDFSYISKKIPTVMIALSAGKSSDGYSFPLHSPKAIFDENALLYGTIVFCILSLGEF